MCVVFGGAETLEVVFFCGSTQLDVSNKVLKAYNSLVKLGASTHGVDKMQDRTARKNFLKFLKIRDSGSIDSHSQPAMTKR